MGDALSRALADLSKQEGVADLCEACGGLSPDAPCSIVVRAGEPLRRCPACGLTLSPEGRAVGHRGEEGRVRVRVVELPPI